MHTECQQVCNPMLQLFNYLQEPYTIVMKWYIFDGKYIMYMMD